MVRLIQTNEVSDSESTARPPSTWFVWSSSFVLTVAGLRLPDAPKVC